MTNGSRGRRLLLCGLALLCGSLVGTQVLAWQARTGQLGIFGVVLLVLEMLWARSTLVVFAVTFDKVDTGRVLDLQRVTADSNRELRLTLNSSAFGPGEYRIRLQGYTWKGQRIDAGWVRLVVQAPTT